MKYDITLRKDGVNELVSASNVRELYSALCLYKAKGYQVVTVANAFRKPRGIVSVSF